MSGKDYKVGYKRPPKHTRFKKGESGNPGGLGGKSPAFFYEELVEAHVWALAQCVANLNGRKVRGAKAIALNNVQTLLKGNPHMLKLIMQMMERGEPASNEDIKIIVEGGLPKKPEPG